MTETRYDKLDQLGKMKGLPSSPDEAELERVKNPCDENYMVRLVAPEFTSICPVTGQPDFAHFPIDVFYSYGKAPEGLWIPDQGVPPYRGRG